MGANYSITVFNILSFQFEFEHVIVINRKLKIFRYSNVVLVINRDLRNDSDKICSKMFETK